MTLDAGRRSLRVWLFAPMLMAVLMLIFAAAGRMFEVRSSPLIAGSAGTVAWVVAWIAWWPVLRPRFGFGTHAAIGVGTAAVVLTLVFAIS